MDLYSLSLFEALKLLETGETCSVELTNSIYSRIDKVDSKIKSYITLCRDEALAQAEKADVLRRDGKGGALCGIPVSIKDVLCTLGIPTTCGSKMLEHFIPAYDASVVTKLKEAGAVIVGKVAMDEFAMGSTSENCAFNIPENPWKSGYIAGGSSGGSAASVAADECLASLGTDTGGSIRQPASLCGVVGLKPTYGRVSRYGLVAFASSLDQVGPLTKNVTDCALMLETISGYDPKDSTSANLVVPKFSDSLQNGLKGVRIGIPQEYFAQGLDPEVEKIVIAGIDMLRDAGAKIIELSLPHTEYCVAVYYIIASAEASSNLARYDGVRYGYRDLEADSLGEMYQNSRSHGFGDEVKRRILIGTYALSSGYYDAYYKKASQVRTLIREDFNTCFEQCDLIVSPVTPVPAWKIGERTNDPLSIYLSDILTISANLSGIPGISVPAGFNNEGLPVGLQIQAPNFNEEILLQAAWNLENRAGIVGRRPAIKI